MALFKDMLGAEESLFLDEVALSYDYIPKLVPYRETQQRHVASCIKPLFANRNGKNVFVFGSPGVGKTVAVKHLLKELEEETEEVVPIYINCWQKNTTFKIISEMCDIIGYKFTHNKRSDELFKILKEYLNKKRVVFTFDEVDKLEDTDFLYYLLEEIYRKTVILITNYKEWLVNIDERIKSRLTAELLEFKPYTKDETKGIMAERLKYAFAANVWDNDAFEIAVDKAFSAGDVRSGLYLLKEAGNAAEEKAARKITKEHMDIAVKKLDEFSIKKKEELEDETKFILEIVKKNTGNKIGDIYKAYQEEGGKAVYKTFQRKINKLAEDKFISVKKLTGGAEGSTTIITHLGSFKTLDKF
ncbi:AAA family ATPase [Candidatus Woesearchaeota archaeon]|nr:AAA family ATPase [Candidatus Woesearchaeota archaeon]